MSLQIIYDLHKLRLLEQKILFSFIFCEFKTFHSDDSHKVEFREKKNCENDLITIIIKLLCNEKSHNAKLVWKETFSSDKYMIK